ncbi:MAG TPA: DUF1700 domain-containing protein [Clostridia bacterium]|nr:DUF1700 domain-containing protein [Clostridia bacterium]
MTRHEFLEELSAALRMAPADVREEVLSDFGEHFDAGSLEGKSEAAIAEALGDPKRIARLYFADDAVKRAREKANLKSIFSMVLAVLRYKLGGGLAVAMAYLICLCAAICIFAGSFALLLAGLGAAALTVASAVKSLWPYFLLYLLALFLFASAGALTFNGGTAFFKRTVKKMPLFAERMMGRGKKGGPSHA